MSKSEHQQAKPLEMPSFIRGGPPKRKGRVMTSFRDPHRELKLAGNQNLDGCILNADRAFGNQSCRTDLGLMTSALFVRMAGGA